MLEKWQFNVLFFVGVGGAVLLLLGPEIGLKELGKNPTAFTGIGAILTYVLTQRKKFTKDDPEPDEEKTPPTTKKEEGDGSQ
jgi:hypothetical protein